jgi:hypothetical protein
LQGLEWWWWWWWRAHKRMFIFQYQMPERLKLEKQKRRQ